MNVPWLSMIFAGVPLPESVMVDFTVVNVPVLISWLKSCSVRVEPVRKLSAPALLILEWLFGKLNAEPAVKFTVAPDAMAMDDWYPNCEVPPMFTLPEPEKVSPIAARIGCAVLIPLLMVSTFEPVSCTVTPATP